MTLDKLALEYFEEGENAKSPEAEIELYKKALAFDPAMIKAWVNLGAAHGKLGNLEDAEKCFEEAIRIGPQAAGISAAYYNLGLVQEKMGKLEHAEESYSKAIEQNPEHNEAFYKLGVVYTKLGNHADARKLFEKVIEQQPGCAEAYHCLAQICEIEGDKEGVVSNFKKALEIKPEFAQAAYNLGLVYADEAKKHLQNAFERDTWLLAKNKLQSALECFQGVYEKDSEYEDVEHCLELAYRYLGRVCYDIEEHSAAKEYLKKALELNPDLKDEQKLLDKLDS